MEIPSCKELCGGLLVTIKRPDLDISNRNGGNAGGNVGGNVAVMKLSYRQQLILSFIAKHFDITAKQMAVMSGIPQRTIERELSILQKVDMICRVGAPRTGRWKLLKQIDFE